MERGAGANEGYPNNPYYLSADKGTIYSANLDFWNQRVTEAGGLLQGITGYVAVASTTNWSPTNTSLTLTNAWLGFLTNWTLAATNLTIEKTGVLQLQPGNLICASNLTVTNGGALYIYSAATNGTGPDYGALVSVGGTLRIAANSWIYPLASIYDGGSPRFQVKDLAISAGGGINADYFGYAGGGAAQIGYGPGGGAGSSSHGGGGGHGGRGGQSDTPALGGPANDATNAPIQPGSGGGGASAGTVGGAGGGLVRIQASGTVTIDGTVTANGAQPANWGGGGAGGGIYISCATFGGSSTGLLSATGGAHGGSSGGGGGGRIALDYSNLTDPAVRLNVERGASCYDGYRNNPLYTNADRGTIYFPNLNFWNQRIAESGGILQGFTGYLVATPVTNWSTNALTLTNAWLGFLTNWTLAATNLTIQNAGALQLLPGNLNCASLTIQNTGVLDLKAGNLICTGDLTVTNGGALYIYSAATNGAGPDYGALVSVGGTLRIASNSWVYPVSSIYDGGSPFFQVKDLTISAGGGINADYFGYAGGVGVAQNGYGPGGGGAGSHSGGGGHGGRGGRSDGGALSGITNDSANAPTQPGSGGGGATSCSGGAGGGLARIQASGTVAIDGAVTARGANGGGSYGGGGAGGGIYISCATFGGSSTGACLSAIGGNGVGTAGGGGGGGLIAVWVDVPPNIRTRCIAAGSGRAVARSTNWPAFSGTFSVTNGTGYTGAADFPLPGAVFFFKYVKGAQLRY